MAPSAASASVGGDRPHVVMATEGTYPYVGGGVSTWCHQLCEGMDGIDYSILAVTGDAEVEWKYERMPSVRRCVLVPMWPGEEPGIFLHPGRFSRVLERRWGTTSRLIADGFVPPLRVLLREIFVGSVPEHELVEAIARLGVFLRRHDYKQAMRSRHTWRAFLDAIAEFTETDAARGAEPPTVDDATTCARWFYNMMMPLAAPPMPCTVFHATIASACALPGVIARQVDGTSFLVTDHGVYLRERYIAISRGEFSQVQKRFLIGIAIAMGRACYGTADIISPVARFNARWELRWGADESRIRVVYNGVDTDLHTVKPKPAELAGRPVAIAAARVFPLKDIETMVRAADVARKLMPEVLFLVYGSLKADPPYVDGCRALIEELGCGDNFQFGGFHPDPFGIFREGDISVLSSISEGFPYTVLEAMASGRPCVATDVGGVREAVGDTGIVVPPRAPEPFGEAVVELLSDDERRRDLAERARERVLSEFTIANQLAGYHELYAELHELTRQRQAAR